MAVDSSEVCSLEAVILDHDPSNCDSKNGPVSLVDSQTMKMTNHAVVCMDPNTHWAADVGVVDIEVADVEVTVFDANDNRCRLRNYLVAVGNLVVDHYKLKFPSKLDDQSA